MNYTRDSYAENYYKVT